MPAPNEKSSKKKIAIAIFIFVILIVIFVFGGIYLKRTLDKKNTPPPTPPPTKKVTIRLAGSTGTELVTIIHKNTTFESIKLAKEGTDFGINEVASGDIISIDFLNDGSEGTADRNVIIRKIIIDNDDKKDLTPYFKKSIDKKTSEAKNFNSPNLNWGRQYILEINF
jgi:uncharacterized protein YneF (UPF0154 family)